MGLWTSDQKVAVTPKIPITIPVIFIQNQHLCSQVFCDLQLDTDAAGDAWWAVYCGDASNRAAAFSGASTNDSHATCYGNGNYNGPQARHEGDDGGRWGN